MSRWAVSAVLAAAACRSPIGACDDDLRGVYVAAAIGEAGGERWMILDDGDSLEAYPLFADEIAGGAATEVAPRVIQLAREHGAIAGQIHRRFMQRAIACESVAPIHVTRCAGDTLELAAGDPSPPLTFAPCTWPAASPSRALRWRRE